MTQTTLATVPPMSSDLSHLGQATQDNVREAVTASKAANTLRAYKSDLRQVAAYLFEAGQTRLVKPDPKNLNRWVLVSPMTPGQVAGYLADKAAQGVAVSSLRRHVATLSKWHQLIAVDNPSLDIANPCDTALVRDTLAGLRRANQRTPDKAAPILEHHLVLQWD